MRPGRGAYVHHDPVCVGEMVRRGSLSKALKRKLVAIEEAEAWRQVDEAANVLRKKEA
jgi:predicted RNA-binding protein YlxR (DUF448 family)